MLILKFKKNIKVQTNEGIRAKEIRVIDENGEMLGVMATEEALLLARSRGLDLIQISPKANPPVVKIQSFDKFRYQQEKLLKQQKKRQKKIEVKGIRISVRIGIHDLDFKTKNTEKFLQDGNKVKIDMFLRGRERANVDFAFEVFKKFLASITFSHTKEQEPKKMGNTITAIIAPVIK